jgi:hypothetical protein
MKKALKIFVGILFAALIAVSCNKEEKIEDTTWRGTQSYGGGYKIEIHLQISDKYAYFTIEEYYDGFLEESYMIKSSYLYSYPEINFDIYDDYMWKGVISDNAMRLYTGEDFGAVTLYKENK